MESVWLPEFYRPLLLVCIGLWGWGFDLLLLSHHQINPSYLLEINHTSNLDPPLHQSIFMLAGVHTLLFSLNLWLYLYLARPEDTSWIPLLAYISSMSVVLWPGDQLYLKERTRFTSLVKRVLSMNLFSKVYFADAIFADLLVSFSNVLGDLFSIGCIILRGGSNETFVALKSDTQNAYYHDLMVPLVTSAPYLIRLGQCISEYINSKGETHRHLYNGLKYASSLPAIIISGVQKKATIYITENGSIPSTWWISECTLFRLWMITVFINSVYSFWWDTFIDWNLVQISFAEPAKQPVKTHHHHHHHKRSTPIIQLRRHFYFPSPVIYLLATMIDFILRVTWGLKFSSHIYIQKINGNLFIMEILEMMRRWIWVIFRMENEWMKRSNLPIAGITIPQSS